MITSVKILTHEKNLSTVPRVVEFTSDTINDTGYVVLKVEEKEYRVLQSVLRGTVEAVAPK